MGFIVKAVKAVVKVVGKVIGAVVKVIGSIFGFSVKKKTDKSKAVNNLNKSLEPEAYRKIVFGRMAAPLDVRFWEVWGTNGKNFDEVIALATHRINSFQQLYLEENLAISGGVVQAAYSSVLSFAVKLGSVGQTALSAGSGSYWTANSKFDGCAHLKLAWVPDETKLPNGIPNRYTAIVEGALVYDPRRDSTVPGGSGAHRANDRTTWEYAPVDGNGVPIGRNNALQALWYLLGWTIPNPVTGEQVLVAGRGIDPEDINMATFIAGANNCETAGYYTDLVLTTEDEHTTNEAKITCGGLIGRLIDPGGLWSYYANVNDTANIAVDLTDADVLEGTSVTWDEYQGMSEQFNQVRGKFVYPASPVLFQQFPYPMVRDATYEANLGVKRSKPLDFEQVLDSTLAQRLARLYLNEGQYQGEFQANFNYRAINAQAWSVVRYTSERFGFTKLFRVWRQNISTDNGVGMLLREIHGSIWGAGTVTAPLAPGLGANYLANQEILPTNVTVANVSITGADGTINDHFRLSWDAPSYVVRRTEVRYRLAGTTFWTTAGPVTREITSILVGPVLSGAIYEAQIRHVTINEVPGAWTAPTGGNFASGTTGNVNIDAIQAAGGTAVWSQITGTGKPENNADVTSTHVASGIAGQGALATKNLASWAGDLSGVPLLTGKAVTVDENLVNAAVWGIASNKLAFDATINHGVIVSSAASPTYAVPTLANSTIIDKEATYEAYWRLAETGTGTPTGIVYTVVCCWDENGNNITGDGSWWFYPVGGMTLSQRGAYERYSSSFGKGTLRPFPENAVRFSVGVLLNYGGTGNDMQCMEMWAQQIEGAGFQANNNWSWQQSNRSLRLSTNRVAPGAWGNGAFSRYMIYGPCSFKFEAAGRQEDGYYGQMAGLSVDQAINYNQHEATFYLIGPKANCQIYAYFANGSGSAQISAGTSLNGNDVFEVVYDGLYYRWFINGAQVYSRYAGANLAHRAAVDTVYTGVVFKSVQFTPGQSAAIIGITTYKSDGTALSTSTLITAEGVASAIAGQGALATLNGVTYGTGQVIGFGALSGLAYVYLGDGKIRRSDGVTTLTEPLVITSQGVASGIAGQGALATLNQAGTSELVLNSVTTGYVVVSNGSADITFTNQSQYYDVLTVAITKAIDASVLELQFNAMIAQYGNWTFDATFMLAIYSGASNIASRTFRLLQDAPYNAIMPVNLKHFFSGISAGSYTVKIMVMRNGANSFAVRNTGEYCMLSSREIKR